jgi:hypothetical protein
MNHPPFLRRLQQQQQHGALLFFLLSSISSLSYLSRCALFALLYSREYL